MTPSDLPEQAYQDFIVIARYPDFVVISKAPGVDVHRDGAEPGIAEKVAEALSLPALYLVHRLDKVTSGLMLLACSAEACAGLAALFRERRIDKFYLALSDRKPRKKQGRIAGDMVRSRRGSWKLIASKNNPAVTQFFSASLQPGCRAFLLKPLTGKTHQLRVAMKSIGAPIKGDPLYADAEEVSGEPRTCLHAYRLRFYWRGAWHTYSQWPGFMGSPTADADNGLHAAWAEPEQLPWPAS